MAICEVSPRAEDPEVLELAVGEGRVLLTEDKDFGQLVYAQGRASGGVLFLRYPSAARSQLAEDVVALVKQQGEGLRSSFAVVEPGRIRISRAPRG